mgnify:CR=1 FL=1
MGLREKIAESLSRVKATMGHDGFQESAQLGKRNKTAENSSDELYSQKHRTKITNRKENQSGRMESKHPGFKSVQHSIEREGYSQKIAGAILASRTRNASAHAKKANPHLARVKGCAARPPGDPNEKTFHNSPRTVARRIHNRRKRSNRFSIATTSRQRNWIFVAPHSTLVHIDFWFQNL